MPSYLNERREAVVAKLLAPRNLQVREVAQQEGISEPAVYRWRNKARERRCVPNAGDQGTAAWSSKGKFAAVLETTAMNGAELAATVKYFVVSESVYAARFSGVMLGLPFAFEVEGNATGGSMKAR